jgi:hypothetical protein
MPIPVRSNACVHAAASVLALASEFSEKCEGVHARGLAECTPLVPHARMHRKCTSLVVRGHKGQGAVRHCACTPACTQREGVVPQVQKDAWRHRRHI